VTAAGFVSENGQVHALEPTPQNFVRLRKNLEPFHWAIAQPYAVGNVTGEVPIHHSDEEAEWASIHDQHRQGNLSCSSAVSAIRLDHWLPDNPVDRIVFIKLDIEGTGLDALLGARQTLSHFHPTIVAETKCGWNHDEICQLLSAAGYGYRSFYRGCVLAIPNLLPARMERASTGTAQLALSVAVSITPHRQSSFPSSENT
jgi:FkbM family methyltransferase